MQPLCWRALNERPQLPYNHPVMFWGTLGAICGLAVVLTLAVSGG